MHRQVQRPTAGHEQMEFPGGQQEPSLQVSSPSGQTQAGSEPATLFAHTFPGGQQNGVPLGCVPQGGCRLGLGQTQVMPSQTSGGGQQPTQPVVLPTPHGVCPRGQTQTPPWQSPLQHRIVALHDSPICRQTAAAVAFPPLNVSRTGATAEARLALRMPRRDTGEASLLLRLSKR
jgi:hypothetical protein